MYVISYVGNHSFIKHEVQTKRIQRVSVDNRMCGGSVQDVNDVLSCGSECCDGLRCAWYVVALLLAIVCQSRQRLKV